MKQTMQASKQTTNPSTNRRYIYIISHTEKRYLLGRKKSMIHRKQSMKKTLSEQANHQPID